MTEQGEWDPGLLLDAGQTPGLGASLTSTMCLLSVIKMELIGGTSAKNNKMTSLEGTRSQLIILNKEGCTGHRQPLRKETVTSTGSQAGLRTPLPYLSGTGQPCPPCMHDQAKLFPATSP